MTDVRVTWKTGLDFTGVSPSGQSVPLAGEGEGFSPMQMLALGLAGCTSMDVISILQKKRQTVTAFEVEAHADRQTGHPKVFAAVRLVYRVTGRGVDEAAVRRAIELSVTKYCPAYAMLCGSIPTVLHYEIFEDRGDGRSAPTASGDWSPGAA